MIISEEIKITANKMVAVKCDACGVEYSCNPTSEDAFEVQEMFNIDVMGGYGAVIGDGTHLEMNICQHCFFARFRDEILRLIS